MIRDYLIRMALSAALFAPVYLLCRWRFLVRAGRWRSGREKGIRELLLLLFAGYLWGMVTLTMDLPSVLRLALREGGFRFHGGINFVPLRQLSAFKEFWVYEFRLVNVVGNVLMFLPMGFCLTALWRRQRPVAVGVIGTFLFSLSIETVQLFSYRSTDVDDLILNTLGGLLGTLVCVVLRRLWPGEWPFEQKS